MKKKIILLLITAFVFSDCNGQSRELPDKPYGWAANSVNAVIFRNNSIVSFDTIQFIAYYNEKGQVCIGKRTLGNDEWYIHETPHKGNTKDAHNCISIMTDGDGYLHIAWNHHGSPLNYTKSKYPLSLELEEKQSMTGKLEDKVTYPGFYKTPDGNLLFLYREGGSGNGNLVLNTYNTRTKTWTQLHDNLIAGEGLRNAYWQACTDKQGAIHLSWVWRETPDVATNHDMCYARSTDGGKTWTTSKGEKYVLPVTAQTAEYAGRIPQKSELINQTSMTTDNAGNPYIATYYRKPDSQIPQYHIIYLDENKQWKDISLDFRKTPFSLSGLGTKKIPIARPQMLCLDKDNQKQWLLIFRDEERGSRVSMASCSDLSTNQWKIEDLTDYPVGEWEPTYDTELWKDRQLLHLFVQKVQQEDGEQNSDLDAQPIMVLDVPVNYKLVWSEEFDYNGKPDTAIWHFEEGFVRNEELQWYQPDNAYCKNGVLTILGKKEQISNTRYEEGSNDWRKNRKFAEYSSTCIKTVGKKEFLYGRFEIRAKIPTASGAWPAIWTLGKSMPWPSNGEIDIMEYYRIKDVPHILANTAWGTDTPYNAKWDTQTVPFSHFTDKDPDWADKFHSWRMDWNEEAIRLYLDDELLNETLLKDTQNGAIGNHTNPFKQPHYILLNLAIGGQNGGTPDDAAFPLKYEIDYVRVYQK